MTAAQQASSAETASVLSQFKKQDVVESGSGDRGSRCYGYLPTLDGWRAIAIIMVIGHHAADSIEQVGGHCARAFMEPLRVHGQVGVDLFFGISGFLICGRLLEEERLTGHISLKGFYIRRSCRILPPAILFLAVVGLLSVAGVVHSPLRHWLSALLFYANYVKGGTWYVAHYWSLAIEEHFYLIWPAILTLVGTRRAARLTLLLIGLTYVWRVVAVKSGLTWGFWGRTDVRIDGLLWGCVVAIGCGNVLWRDRLARVLTPWAWGALLILFVACVAIPNRPFRWHFVAMIFQAAVIPLVIVGTVLHPRNVPGRMLESLPMRWIGRHSYSLYLWQQLFLVWDSQRSMSMGVLQSWPINLACVVACAVVSYRLIERPFIRMGHWFAAPATAGRGDMSK